MRKRTSAGMAIPRDGRCMQCGWMSGDISCTSGEKRTHPSYGKIKNSTWETATAASWNLEADQFFVYIIRIRVVYLNVP